MNENKSKGFKLGELLIQKGYITWEQLEEILNLQAQSGDVKKVLTYKTKPKNKPLSVGEILVKNGWITWDQLSEALAIQAKTGEILGSILMEKKFVSKKDLYRALAIQSDIAFVDFDKISIPPEVVGIVPKRIAIDHQIMPLVKRGTVLLIATSDPKKIKIDPSLFPDLEVHVALAIPEDIQAALRKHYGA